MKTKPSAAKKEKINYLVILDGEHYSTYAFNENGAISNAAFRRSEEVDEDVKLIMWKIREGQLDCEVSLA